jgi:hypothetical protein
MHTLLDTYINCGHIWHRNGLFRCQIELLVSCSNDEHQTSLKWDRSSHPVAPECRVSHTVRLKHFTNNVLVISPSELCSRAFNVAAAWKFGFTVRLWRSIKYPQAINFVNKRNPLGSHKVGVLYYSLRVGNNLIRGSVKPYVNIFVYPCGSTFVLWVTCCLQM